MWAKLGPSCSLSCPALPPFPLPVPRGPFVVVVGGGLLGPSLLSFFLTLLFLLWLAMSTHQNTPLPSGPFCPDRTGPAEAQPSLLSCLEAAWKATGLRRPKLPPPSRDPICQLLLPKWVTKKKRAYNPSPARRASFRFI